MLEDDTDLREGLCDLLVLMGASSCSGLATFRELVELGDRALETDVAFLDVNLGPDQPSGVDAYLWLQERGYRGEIVLLTGHGRAHPLVRAAERLGVRVLEKPLDGGLLESFAGEEAR